MAIEVKIKGYQCEKCGKVFIKEELAECCCKEYVCAVCGRKTNKYVTKCEECKEKEYYDKARKLTYDKYWDEFKTEGVFYGDDYYNSLDELVEQLAEMQDEVEIPKYVWGARRVVVGIDVDSAMERALEEAYEDAEFSSKGRAELYEFAKEWNEEYGLECFERDNSIVVYVPEEYRESV